MIDYINVLAKVVNFGYLLWFSYYNLVVLNCYYYYYYIITLVSKIVPVSLTHGNLFIDSLKENIFFFMKSYITEIWENDVISGFINDVVCFINLVKLVIPNQILQ